MINLNHLSSKHQKKYLSIPKEIFLQKALKSAQEQSYQNIEIIIVDSSDNTDTQNYISQNKNIMYVHSGINHPNVLRNLGIQCSNGELIAFLDDDDIWFPTKLEKQLKAMEETGCNMSSTEGLHGDRDERYDKNKRYKKY
mgnify:CR=1 FL=1